MKYNDLIPELIVSNLECSLDFYVHVLGFKIEYQRKEEKFVFLSYNGIQIMLEEGSKEQLTLMSYPFGGGINFTFGMQNVETLYETFKVLQYPIEKDLCLREFQVEGEWIRELEFAVLDPDGYYIRIVN